MTGELGIGIIRSMIVNHLTVTTSEIIKAEEFPLVCVLISLTMLSPAGRSHDLACQ